MTLLVKLVIELVEFEKVPVLEQLRMAEAWAAVRSELLLVMLRP
jgi:hypothetical protein